MLTSTLIYRNLSSDFDFREQPTGQVSSDIAVRLSAVHERHDTLQDTLGGGARVRV